MRLLLVHAHPDDELLATGVLLARAARTGHDVHVLTCTLGDEGEVIPEPLAGLEGSDDLAAYRRGELARAMAQLGVRHRVLGERDESTPDPAAVRFRDSGMAGSAAAAHPRAWAGADLDGAARAVLDVVQDVRPDVVVTYDPHGGYEHPDHVRTHDAVCRALALMPDADRPPLFAQVTPRSWAAEDRAWVAANVRPQPGGPDVAGARPSGRTTVPGRVIVPGPDEPYPAVVVPDEVVTHQVVAEPADLALRDAALAHHATQVTVHDGWFVLSNDVAARLAVREGYARMDPATGALLPAAGAAAPGERADLLGVDLGARPEPEDTPAGTGEPPATVDDAAGPATVEASQVAALPPVDPTAFRTAMAELPTGVVAVSTRAGDADLAITVGSFASLSLDPPLVMFGVSSGTRFAEAVGEAGRFAVSVLGAAHRDVALRLATRGRSLTAHLDGVPHHRGKGGCAIIEGAPVVLECTLWAAHPGGDHLVVIGEVQTLQVAPAGDPLVFHRGRLGG